MRAEEIKGLMEAYSHVYETPEVLSEASVPERIARGLGNALKDLPAATMSQLQGQGAVKANDAALKRQQERGKNLQQLITTGKLPGTSTAKPTKTKPEVQNQIDKNQRDRNTMNPGDYFGTNPEKPKPSPGPGSNRPTPGGTPSESPGGSPSNVISAKNIAGQSQKVTVGRKYGATLGGQKGNVTYDASGKRTFVADKPSTAAEKPTATPTSDKPSPSSTPAAKPSAMDQWAKANPKLAAAAAEKARIRGTSQTDNPLMKDMRSKMSMTPSVQSPTLAKDLGKGGGNQSLLNNPNASKAAPPKPVATATPAPKPEAPAPKPKPPAGGFSTKEGDGKPRKPEDVLFHTDLFDLVKGHLLDEGYAETEENALVIMANMSEEWRESILEAILDESSYSAKAARAGKDIGKPGKMFGKIAKEAGERYGSEERGKKVAGAVLAKLRKEEVEEIDEAQRARENPEDHDKEEKRKYEPVRGEKTPMPPRGDKRREDFEKWYAKHVR